MRAGSYICPIPVKPMMVSVAQAFSRLMLSPRIPADRYDLAPSDRGLYCFWHRFRCLYVGRSKNLRERMAEHMRGDGDPGLAGYVREHEGEITVSCSRLGCSDWFIRIAEIFAILKLKPKFNDRHVRRAAWFRPARLTCHHAC